MEMNLPLPEANSATAAEVREWLDRFAVCMRKLDYAAARPFCHPTSIFGTYQELVKSLSAWTERQWDNVWPPTAEFRFDLANIKQTLPGARHTLLTWASLIGNTVSGLGPYECLRVGSDVTTCIQFPKPGSLPRRP